MCFRFYKIIDDGAGAKAYKGSHTGVLPYTPSREAEEGSWSAQEEDQRIHQTR
jgi:hypothetical protein